MANAFQTAVDFLFKDRNLSVEATFKGKRKARRSVRVILRQPDVYEQTGFSSVEIPTLTLEVSTAVCPKISPRDTFRIGKITYTVQGEPRRDNDHLIWHVDCYAT